MKYSYSDPYAHLKKQLVDKGVQEEIAELVFDWYDRIERFKAEARAEEKEFPEKGSSRFRDKVNTLVYARAEIMNAVELVINDTELFGKAFYPAKHKQ